MDDEFTGKRFDILNGEASLELRWTPKGDYVYYDDARDVAERLQSEVNSLEYQLQDTERLLEEVRGDMEDYKERYEAADLACDNYRDTICELRDEIIDLRERLDG